MNKYILGIDGMKCGMCEAHVQNIINKNLKVKKVKASHTKNELIVICEDELNEEYFHNIIDPTGYIIKSFKKEEAIKKLIGWK